MKKINLKGIKEILSERELKSVSGGSGGYCFECMNGASGYIGPGSGDPVDLFGDFCPAGGQMWAC